MRLAGGNAKAAAAPVDRLPGTIAYFLGSDPSRWRTGIATYGKVEYLAVYSGVDVVYYGNGRQLEYDFRLAGRRRSVGDPAGVRRRSAAYGVARRRARGRRPEAAQAGGVPDGRGRAHGGGMRLRIAGIGGSRDAARRVRPTPAAGHRPGAQLCDVHWRDGERRRDKRESGRVGEIYLAGFTSSNNFPARGAAQTNYAGNNSSLAQLQFGDAFVAKLNPTGTSLVYATYLGGSGDDFATSIAIDAAGNAYVTGNTQSTNFPTTNGAPQRTAKGFGGDDNGFYNPSDA